MASLNGRGGAPRDQTIAKGYKLAERALAIDPEDPMANIALATMARFSGHYDTAIKAIETALLVTPDSGLALFVNADAALSMGWPEDVVPVLERAILLNPACSHQHLQFLGSAHLFMGNFETAALAFRERLVLMPGTDIGRAWLAATLGHIVELDEARALWSELLQKDPEFDIKTRLGRFGYLRPEDPAAVLTGLSKAGIVV